MKKVTNASWFWRIIGQW